MKNEAKKWRNHAQYLRTHGAEAGLCRWLSDLFMKDRCDRLNEAQCWNRHIKRREWLSLFEPVEQRRSGLHTSAYWWPVDYGPKYEGHAGATSEGRAIAADLIAAMLDAGDLTFE